MSAHSAHVSASCSAHSPRSADWLNFSPSQWREMEELPACCSGTRKQLCVDIDETVHGGKKVAEFWGQSGSAAKAVPTGPIAPLQPPPRAEASMWSAWTQRVPKPHVPWPMAALTLWTAVPGFVFSCQNYVQAQRVGALLTRLNTALASRAQALEEGEAKQNIRAYQDTVAHSLSMQHFIAYFAGLLAGASSILVVATLFSPALEIAALSTLMGYCASFAVRYTRWDKPRWSQPAASPVASTPFVEEGRSHAESIRAERNDLFLKTGGFFGVYGIGAGVLAGASAVSSLALTLGGMGALFVGMIAVTYYNNFPMKETFGKNRDRHLNREQLGTIDDIYRTIAVRQHQAKQLAAFDSDLVELGQLRRDRTDQAFFVLEWATIGFTLATLGLWPGPLHAVQQQIRERQLARLQRMPALKQKVEQLVADLERLDFAEAEQAERAIPIRAPLEPSASFGELLQRLDGLFAEGLLEYAGHTSSAGPHHDHDHDHDHDHTHGSHAGCKAGQHGVHATHLSTAPVDWEQEDVQLAALHALRFGLRGEKEFQSAALVDHVFARSRLLAMSHRP